ncbi:hypothetical protein HHK36_002534 [Tetracentron sinense]|uniref:Uncharacterized protein n=1 Tax=Tetracentron sinense TaxID=13715 RepID=A0A835DR79_TETSI|nr:hypothetical protein HHK36_002534 [Tetracentron sinense]
MTRFATAYLTLQSINKKKDALRKVVTCDEWNKSKWPRDLKGKRAMETVLSTSFWNDIVYAMKVTAPLVRVLRLVDGEKRPPMGYIYEAIDRAKEAIKEALGGQRNERNSTNLFMQLDTTSIRSFFYANSDIDSCEEVVRGLLTVIERLVPDLDAQDAMTRELAVYRNAEGLFGS